MNTIQYPRVLKIIEGGPWSLPQIQGHFDNPLTSRYTNILQKYELEKVVKKGADEIEKFLLLKEWVAQKLQRHGWSFLTLDHRPEHADQILSMAEQGIRFHCGFYAIVFRECCTALGYPSRIIGISIKDAAFCLERKHNIGHAVTEVWSNNLNKWVVMDCDSNLHYEKNGFPLSAAEMSIEYHENQSQCVKPIYGSYIEGWDYGTSKYVEGYSEEEAKRQTEIFQKHHAMDYYSIVSTAIKTQPYSTLCFAPKGINPQLVSDFIPTSPLVDWTSDIHHFNWGMNQTVIRLSCQDRVRPFPPLLAQFITNTDHFDHYLYSLDGLNWERSNGSIVMEIKEGINELIVKSVNVMNLAGPPARALVEYAGPQQVISKTEG